MPVHLTHQLMTNYLIIRVSGELDLHAAPEFRHKVEDELARTSSKHLLLDFTALTFIDSSGLGAILGRYKTIRQLPGKMSIFGAGGTVRRILELAGINKLIPLCETERQAASC